MGAIPFHEMLGEELRKSLPEVREDYVPSERVLRRRGNTSRRSRTMDSSRTISVGNIFYSRPAGLCVHGLQSGISALCTTTRATHLREQYQEFIDEYYDLYYVLPKMPIYYKNVTFKDLRGWASKIKIKKALAGHTATRIDITPFEIDYLSKLLKLVCKN